MGLTRPHHTVPLGTVRAEDLPASPTASEQPYTYIIGMGQGDLSKGRLVCERVAELAARTDVAKQIQVLVKEEIRDRVRERTGRAVEQDIEIVREEHMRRIARTRPHCRAQRRYSRRHLYE